MRQILLALGITFGAIAPLRAQEAPSYTKTIQPFFEKYCVECHRTGKTKGAVNLEDYDAVMRGRAGKKMVIPGDPDNSKLLRVVEGKSRPTMPPRRSPQPEDKDIEVLRDWIKNGAKNDPPRKDAGRGEQPSSILSAVALTATGASAAQSDGESPSYAKQVRPFLFKYCLECHNTKEAKGGLILETYKDILEGSNKGAVLVPGEPQKSKLVRLLDGKATPMMPPEKAKLHPKADEIAMLAAWVKAGARDDSRDIKVAIPDVKPRKPAVAPVVALIYTSRSLLAAQRETLHPIQGKQGKLQETRSFSQPITALASSQDGALVAIAAGRPGEPSVVFLEELDASAGDKVVETVFKELHADTVLSMAISPDNKTLATAGYDTQVKLVDIASKGKNVRALKEHSDAVYAVAFSPDSKLLASCGADRSVKVWDVASGKLLYTLGDATDWLYTLAWSPDGEHLAAGGVDRSIRVYNVNADGGKIIHSVFAHQGPVQKLAFAKDGKTLYSLGEDRIVKAWDAGRMVEKKLYDKLPDTGLALAVSDGEVAVGLYDGSIRLIDSGTGKWSDVTPSGKLVLRQDDKGGTSKGPVPQPEPAKITPGFGARGKPIRVVIEGKGLDQAEAFSIDQPGATGKILSKSADKLEAEIAFPATTPAGQAKIAVKSATGVLKELTFVVDLFPLTKIPRAIDSPAHAESFPLPATIVGTLERTGRVHYYGVEARKGDQLGVQVLSKAIGSKLEPFLRLLDSDGKVLAEGSDGRLGHTFAVAGRYAIEVRDRELRGGSDFFYRLHIGEIPIVTSLFPLGGQRGTEIDVRVQGVFLGAEKVHVKIPADAAVGSKVAIPLTTPHGKPLGPLEVVVGEFPEASDQSIKVPGTANGILAKPEQADLWRFSAKKGMRLIVEVHGQRLGSPIASVIEILDAQGKPIPRAVLRCQAKTAVTFRDHDSAGANIRIEAWGELAINDYLYVGQELMRIKELPTHPDADCMFFSAGGRRTGFLDTTPTHHAMNEPMYKVTIHPPGTTFPPNGYPIFTLPYRNDDGGPGFGGDSRLFFDPLADGEYQVRVSDARAMGGPSYGYRLTVRPPRPSFNIRFEPTKPVVSKDGAVPITVTAERLDGYDGPIHIQLADLPPGFQAPATTIDAGQHTTVFALYAAADAKTPAQPTPIRLVAWAEIAGKKMTKEVAGESPRLIEQGDIVCFTAESEVSVRPGGQGKLTVHVERKNGFKGRIPLEVRGLPHGVRVLDIGLNGILVNEDETRRTIVIYAEPWVEAMSHPIAVLARREGKDSLHGAKAVTLKVTGKQ